MRANRRWRAKQKSLRELERRNFAAATAERKALREYYWREMKRRVYQLNTPSAWKLAERLNEYLDIDLTDQLVDLLHDAMKPTDRPRPTRRIVRRPRS